MFKSPNSQASLYCAMFGVKTTSGLAQIILLVHTMTRLKTQKWYLTNDDYNVNIRIKFTY